MDTESPKNVDSEGPAGEKVAILDENPPETPNLPAAVSTVPAAAPEWLSRDEAAVALGKSARTVDRLRDAGILSDVPGPGVRVSVASLEAYLQRKLEPRAAVRTIPVEAEHYDGLIFQLANKTRQLAEMSTKLLTWEQDQDRHAAALKDLREEAEYARVQAAREIGQAAGRAEAALEAAAAAAAEALAEAEARAAATLEAERSAAAAALAETERRAAEALAEAEANAEAVLEAERSAAAAAVAKAEAEREALRLEAQELVDKKNLTLQTLEAELQAERARGFWSRIFGK